MAVTVVFNWKPESRKPAKRRLLRTSDDLAIIPSGEIIDTYGRLLAYFTPWYDGTAADPLPPAVNPDRYTFNLNMIASGWAAFFPVYPSLQKDSDLNLAIAAAEEAWSKKLGQWKDNGAEFLIAYGSVPP